MKEKKYIIDNPNLMAEWDTEKNLSLNFNPKKLALGSGKKVWWKCQKGHEWQAVIVDRTYGTGCPYCSNRKVLRGYNDLATNNPELAKEWNYVKNDGLTPMDVFPSSNKKVWWRCQRGHEWQSIINARNKGVGCPYCSNKKILPGYNDLVEVNPELAKEWNYEKNGDLTPEMVAINSGKMIWWKCQKGHEWKARIYSRNKGSGCPICQAERHTSFPEYALIYYLKKYGFDVIHLYKERGYELDIYIPSKKIAIEYDGFYWHNNKTERELKKNIKCKNDEITLYRIRDGLPPLNDSSIDYVVQKNQKNLPKVIAQVLFEITKMNVDVDIQRDSIAIENLRVYIEKENSLLFCNPQLAKEWNYEKNEKLKPEHFVVNSGKIVWWKCKKGHEWRAQIASRNKGCGCPYCSGRSAVVGENDLLTLNSILVKEWNEGLNKNLNPKHFTLNSGKKVWWKCQKGHAWQATIQNRNKGSGCPYCSNQKILSGYNDLETINPKLAKEWDYVLNGKVNPKCVSPNSHQKVWWKCDKSHKWQATIKDRNNGNGCPYCSGRKVLLGYNDLETINPELAKEWDYALNRNVNPKCVSPNSHQKVWWKCDKSHKWQATIKDRNNGNGCPYCSNRKVLKGYNDLATNNPKLAKEWDFDLNENLKPDEVTQKSNKKVWWKCDKGHEWQSTVSNRANGNGCPYCSKRRKLDTSLNKS